MKKNFLILFVTFFLLACKSDQLSILTYNIRLNVDSDGENAWPYRKDFLIDQIIFHEPDIFGIQEGLPDQVTYLNEQLEKYDFIGIGRDGH